MTEQVLLSQLDYGTVPVLHAIQKALKAYRLNVDQYEDASKDLDKYRTTVFSSVPKANEKARRYLEKHRPLIKEKQETALGFCQGYNDALTELEDLAENVTEDDWYKIVTFYGEPKEEWYSLIHENKHYFFPFRPNREQLRRNAQGR